MFEDNHRLVYDIRSDINSFTIYDEASQETCLVNNGELIIDTIPRKLILRHLQNLQESISDIVGSKYISTSFVPVKGLQIRETKHFSYEFMYKREVARLTPDNFERTKNFDINLINKYLKDIYNVFYKKTKKPKHERIIYYDKQTDILRIAWGDHVIITRGSTRIGRILHNCIVDDKIYEYVIINPELHDGKTFILTPDSDDRLLFKLPIDDSVMEIFDEE